MVNVFTTRTVNPAVIPIGKDTQSDKQVEMEDFQMPQVIEAQDMDIAGEVVIETHKPYPREGETGVVVSSAHHNREASSSGRRKKSKIRPIRVRKGGLGSTKNNSSDESTSEDLSVSEHDSADPTSFQQPQLLDLPRQRTMHRPKSPGKSW